MAEPDLGILLFVAFRHMEQRAFDAVAAAGHTITLAQGRVFRRVAEEGSRLTTLAGAADVTKQSAGVLVDGLVEAGYLERRPDPTDRRARLITITARGREVQAIGRAVIAEIEAEWLAHLGQDDVDNLRDILTRLREITDPYQ
jgi:DNA-binding MarR family transcriptional regulator